MISESKSFIYSCNTSLLSTFSMPDIMESETEKVPTLQEMTAQLGKTEHEHIPHQRKGTLSDTDDCSEEIIPDDLPL